MFAFTSPYWAGHLSRSQALEFIRTNTRGLGPVVSVGSGSGHLEAALSVDRLDPVICIDPAPSEYLNMEPVIQPRWETVPAMLEEEFPVESTLLLIWPSFGGYDLEAIQLLRPAEIFLLYEENGAAGSTQLHQWIRDGSPGYTLADDITHWADLPFLGTMNYILAHFVRV